MAKDTYPLSIVLGKFMPPHHGHRFVITTALAQSQRIVIIVCCQPQDSIPADVRADWLRQLYSKAIVKVMDVTWPITEEASWASGTLAVVGEQPAAVFSSDRYAERLAELLHCDHVMVDRERQQVPISASQIRQDPERYREYLDPIVAKFFSPNKGQT